MPFVVLEELGVRSFYVLNPTEKPVEGQWLSDNPASEPFDPAKPTLVLLHCATTSSAILVQQIFDPRLRHSNNIVAIDFRVSGRTQELRPRKKVSIQDCAATIQATLDKLDIQYYSVFGEGASGCQSAIWLAHNRPEKVRCIALSSPGWREESPQIVDSFKQLPPLFDLNKGENGDQTGTLTEEALLIGADYFIGAQSRLAKFRQQYENHLQWRYGTGRSFFDIEQILGWGHDREAFPPAVIQSIQCPVLLLHGGDDSVVTPQAAIDEWASLFKQAKGGLAVNKIAGAPHIISLTDSNIINRFLFAFMSRNNKA